MIRAENPNSIFGSPFTPPVNFKPVTLVPKPDVNPLTHYIIEAKPAWGPNAEFVQQWEIVEHDQIEKGKLLTAKREVVWGAIKNIRDERMHTGGYRVGDKWFHSDLFSRQQQLALVIMGANVPVDLKWKTMDGTSVVMTKSLASDIFAAQATSDQRLFAYAEELRSKVRDALNPSLINITAGWPAVFGE